MQSRLLYVSGGRILQLVYRSNLLYFSTLITLISDLSGMWLQCGIQLSLALKCMYVQLATSVYLLLLLILTMEPWKLSLKLMGKAQSSYTDKHNFIHSKYVRWCVAAFMARHILSVCSVHIMFNCLLCVRKQARGVWHLCLESGILHMTPKQTNHYLVSLEGIHWLFFEYYRMVTLIWHQVHTYILHKHFMYCGEFHSNACHTMSGCNHQPPSAWSQITSFY